jgi:putative tryptophan/tyrosine transport system substrate-binding protein
MRRRDFLKVTAFAVVALEARAQERRKIHRVAVLMTTQRDRVWHLSVALMDALRELGYVEGQNVMFDHRFAEGRMDKLDGLAAELVALTPDVIVVGPNTSVVAAMRASKTIPIVMTVSTEPVASGLVASLNQPGGNITGLAADVTPDTWGLRLQFLKEINEKISRIAVLWNPEVLGMPDSWQATATAAKRLGITLISHEARSINDLNTAFDLIPRDAADALMVFGDGLTYARRREIIDFAARTRLLDFYTWREMAVDGGLISYGYNLADAYRRSAKYVDKILKGAKPGDLPIELPVKLELVINLKRARSLGLTMPSQLLTRADEVIE